MTTPSTPPEQGASPGQPPARPRRGRLTLWLILLACAAPVIASYTMYYVVRPEGRTNYGELLDPQRSAGALSGQRLDGAPFAIGELRGKWVMVALDAGGCDQPCAERLVAMRQVRLTTGRERDRVERLLLLFGDGTPSPELLAQHEGLVVARVDAAGAERLFPAEASTTARDHVFMVDPLGNLMMRFPANADPNRMKKDLSRLLRASRVG